jgi:FkbM family methyltransferase
MSAPTATSAERPAGLDAVNARLARLERDLMRVMSIVANPAPRATYLGNGLVFLPTAHGLPLIGFADDLQLTPSLLQSRTWDEPTTRVMERIIRPGDRMLDIGANIGYFTIYGAALAGGTGHVHAFEPNPRTHALLARNVRLNNFSHVCTLHAAALGDRLGDVTLHTFRNNQGGSTLSTLPAQLLAEWHEHPVDHRVPMTTLDDVFGESLETFACIKIDAEGSEATIWAGGRRFFRERVTDRTIILLEWNPPALQGAGADRRGLMETFRWHNFQVWRRTDRPGAIPVTDVDQLDDWCNCELVLARDPARVAEVFG